MKPIRLTLTTLALTLPLADARAATLTTDTTIGAGDTTYDGQPIIVSGCTLTVDGPHAFASLLVTNAGWVVHSSPASNRLDLTIAGDMVVATNAFICGNAQLVVQGKVLIASGGYLYANGRGYPIGTNYGPGAGSTSPWYGAGGGHGGPGGNGNAANGISPGGVSYGNPVEPTDRGSAGGHGGGAGGGVLKLDVAGTLQVDGYLLAGGDNAVNYWSSGGGGAGGSLWIRAGNVAGSGNISVNGGNGDLVGSVGGGCD